MAHRALRLLSTLLAFTCIATSRGEASPVRPIPQITRVLLVSVDGLRPDLALLANGPSMRALMARGTYTLWAKTTALAVTLPSHTSMLTGVPPSKHGITWNSARPASEQVYPRWPTLFEIAREAGYTTAMAAGKPKFSTLAKPGTLTRSFVPSDSIPSDAAVTDTAIAWIRSLAPTVLFVHLPNVDLAGHSEGWGSSHQLAAIAEADRCVGRLLAALEARGITDSTLVLLTADHGGAGKSHGPDETRSLMIPWIVAGPGVRQGFDLTTEADVSVRTEDTFATLCYVLGITPPRPIEGHPVLAAFSEQHERRTQR